MDNNQLLRKISNVLLGSPNPQGEPEATAKNLLDFAVMLRSWSKNVNLISEATLEEVIAEHILDAVYAEFHLPEAAEILDVGSGAGLPGIPLAILRPKSRVILVEPRAKPVSFLNEVRRRFKLGNIDIRKERIEAVSSGALGLDSGQAIAVARAFSPAEELLAHISWIFKAHIPFYYLGSVDSKALRVKDAQLCTPLPYYPGARSKVLLRLSG